MEITRDPDQLKPPRRATSADVARAAGVSRTTVSFVLNGTPNQVISEATRRRVHEAANRLNYVPSAAALRLQSGISRIVLCLLPDLRPSEPVAQLLSKLSDHLRQAGLTCLVHQGTLTGRDLAGLLSSVDPALVLALYPLPEPDLQAIRHAGITVLGPKPDSQYSMRGRIDQNQIGYLQARHLIDLGHQVLGFAATTHPFEQFFGTPRLAGVQRACREAALAPPMVCNLDGDVADAARAVQRWLHAKPSVTAVCAHNDDLGLLVLAGLRVCGLQAPNDLSVIGVDDTRGGRLSTPTLSTIWLNIDAAAVSLAEQVAQALKRRPPPGIPPPAPLTNELLHVIARESTRAPGQPPPAQDRGTAT